MARVFGGPRHALFVLCATLVFFASCLPLVTSDTTETYLDTDFKCLKDGCCQSDYVPFAIPDFGIAFDDGTLSYENGRGAVTNSPVFQGVLGHLKRFDLYQPTAPIVTATDGLLVTFELTQSCQTFKVNKNLPFTNIPDPLTDYRLASHVASLNDFTTGIYFGTICDGSYMRASWGVLPQVLGGNQIAWYESQHILKSRPNSINQATKVRIVYDRDNGTVRWYLGGKTKPEFVAYNIGIPEIGSPNLASTFLPKGSYPEQVAKSAILTLGFGTSNFEDHLVFGQTQALAQLGSVPLYSTLDGLTPATYQVVNPGFAAVNYGQGAAGALKKVKITVTQKSP